LDLAARQVRWAVAVDTAACFGVYYSAKRDALLSHGECEITRISRAGEVLWSSSGADIFTEGFDLKEAWVEAVDFDQKQYRFDYETGKEIGT
jgi:hypothetical protein